MSNRHLSRTIVLQTLYVWDFHGCSKGILKQALKYNIQQFAPGLVDLSFIRDLIATILKQQKELDDLIEEYATDWPLDKLTIIDRNILRLSLAEINYFKDIPQRATIDQAIELAKTFGGDSSAKFISGVLGAYYDDLKSERLGIRNQDINS